MRALFAFIAGFFRNAAPESSTRLVGILAAIVGLALASVLIVRSCTGVSPTDRAVSWTDIVVVFGVFAFCCTALGLRSPFPIELMTPPGVSGAKITASTETTEIKQTATTTTAEPK